MTIMTVALAMAVVMMIAALQTIIDENRRDLYRRLRAANRGRFVD